MILFSLFLLIHHTLGEVIDKENYVGCYKDGGFNDRLITGYQEDLPKTNKPKTCIDLCHSKGFGIAGLQYEVQCFCGSTLPSFNLRAEESDCNRKCPGDKNEICGGDWRFSVYKTGLKVFNYEKAEKGMEYIGCFIDDKPNDRLLNGFYQNFVKSLTPHFCAGICYYLGYLYAGMQWGQECFCGDRHPFSEKKVADSDCNMACTGDKDKKCGGDWRTSLYSTSITDYPSDGKYIGCFLNPGEKRILKGSKFYLKSTNTPKKCMNLCYINNYQYAGLEYNYECFCGNEKLPELAASDKDCRKECPGDSTDRCGGDWKLAVYRTGLSYTLDNSNEFYFSQYLGCFKDKGSFNKRLFKEFRQDIYGKLTPQLCIDICRSKGFHYSAMQFGAECFCDNERPSTNLLISEDKCNHTCGGDSSNKCGGDWTLSVYKTGLKSPTGNSVNYLGCYADDAKHGRLLKDVKIFNKFLTSTLCTSYCLHQGYSLAGTKRGIECWCGDTDLSNAKELDTSECSNACSGDSSKKCGGNLNMSIYKTGVILKTDEDVNVSYLGCFNSTKKIVNSYKVDSERNSPQHCIGVCKASGYYYAGVEYREQCFCGYISPPHNLKVADSECNMPCPGNKNKFCGGDWRMGIYSTGIGATIQNKNSGGIGKTPCTSSVTLTNGKTAPCKGEVIFEQSFDRPLSKDVWQHTVKLSDSPDENFVIFSKDEKYSFTKDGKLHIRPFLLPKSVVEGGHITLIGCTGVAGTPECNPESFSFRIIPPVGSAQLSTRNSFSFKYGVVEIIAKLPRGDWIIPEIYLEPKIQAYGPDLLSGRIVIAMALGNEDLQTKNGVQIGSRCLESGILMGEQSRIANRHVTKCISEGWNQLFHNYTLIWTSDDIKFIIDGEDQPTIMTGVKNKLCSELGLNNLCENIWTSESKIAPFDREFYIKLGVTVGGSRIFPDDILTNHGQIKPWKNFEVKSLLKFWNKSEEWSQTWTDPSMQIKSIKVTAL